MDPQSSAEFTTDGTSAEPKSVLCEVLPVPTESAAPLGSRSTLSLQREHAWVCAQNKAGCLGQLPSWGRGSRTYAEESRIQLFAEHEAHPRTAGRTGAGWGES